MRFKANVRVVRLGMQAEQVDSFEGQTLMDVSCKVSSFVQSLPYLPENPIVAVTVQYNQTDLIEAEEYRRARAEHVARH